jgi:hypothetical protein
MGPHIELSAAAAADRRPAAMIPTIQRPLALAVRRPAANAQLFCTISTKLRQTAHFAAHDRNANNSSKERNSVPLLRRFTKPRYSPPIASSFGHIFPDERRASPRASDCVEFRPGHWPPAALGIKNPEQYGARAMLSSFVATTR